MTAAVLDIARAVAVTGIEALACLGFGSLALRAVGVWRDLPPGERFAYGYPLGFGLVGVAMFFLGVAGLYRADAAAVLLAAGLAGLWLWRGTAVTWTGPGRWGLPLLIALAAVALLYGLIALPPPTDADSLAYHFNLPKRFAEAGHLFFVPRAIDGASPMTVQMTYLPAWLLGGERAMTLWAGTQGLALGGVVYVFARRWLSVEWALLLVLLVATTPAVVYGGTSGQVEVKNALFVTAAAFAAARSMGGSGWRWALLAGLLAGLFMGSKYLGLFFVAAVGLAVLPQRRWFAAGAACGLAAMAVGAPWYVWNFVHTGDPVFPMLFHSLGLPDGPYWNAAHDAVFRANFSGDELAVPSSPWWALAYPFVATFDPYPVFEGGRTGLGPWAAMALGPALVGIWAARGRIRRSPLAIVVLVAALFYLLWFLIPSSQRIRHILPIWPIAALALTVAARRGADAIARRGGRPLALALAAVAGFQIAVMGLFGAQFVRYLVGGETRESYLIRTVDRYPLVPYLETLLGPGDKVAMPYRQLQFYMDFPHLHIPPYLQTRVEMLAGPPLTGAAWAERFARLGVTHVVVDDLQTDAPPEGEPFNRMGWAVQHSGRFARVGTLEVPAVASRTLGAAGWSLVMHVMKVE